MGSQLLLARNAKSSVNLMLLDPDYKGFVRKG